MLYCPRTGIIAWAVSFSLMAVVFDLSNDRFKLGTAIFLTMGFGIATAFNNIRTHSNGIPIGVTIWTICLGLFYLTFGWVNVFQLVLAVIISVGWANVFYQIAAWLSTEIKKMEKEVMIPHG